MGILLIIGALATLGYIGYRLWSNTTPTPPPFIYPTHREPSPYDRPGKVGRQVQPGVKRRRRDDPAVQAQQDVLYVAPAYMGFDEPISSGAASHSWGGGDSGGAGASGSWDSGSSGDSGGGDGGGGGGGD